MSITPNSPISLAIAVVHIRCAPAWTRRISRSSFKNPTVVVRSSRARFGYSLRSEDGSSPITLDKRNHSRPTAEQILFYFFPFMLTKIKAR